MSALSPEEAAGLLYMLEEEKLARDVYTELYSLWGASTFQTIAASEQMHMNQIQALLARYSLTDPAMPAGTYSNSDLQALHDELVRRGGQSLAEALKVGASIEEIDILDLQKRLSQTSATDIQAVYNNLLRGSYNHLRAYTGALARQTGETYQPQYMTSTQLQTILADRNGYGNALAPNGQVSGTYGSQAATGAGGRPTWAGGGGVGGRP